MRAQRVILVFLVLSLFSTTMFLLLVVSVRRSSDCTCSGTEKISVKPSSMVKPNVRSSGNYQVRSTTATEISADLLELSDHPNIEKRGKFQQEQISKLCGTHFFSDEQSFPNDQYRLSSFYEHLLFDDSREVVFCYVPKVGCTNMKRLLFYMSDALPMYTVDWPWVDYKKYLLPAAQKSSFLNSTLTHSDKMKRLNSYYKFMMVRNPLERLVSAYRDKLSKPLLFGSEDTFPEKVKVEILEKYRHKELSVWKKVVTIREYNISVTFNEFIRYFTENTDINEHFVPSFDLCHPCLINYNFYGHFKNISADSAKLIDKFGVDRSFYRDESLHAPGNQTREKLLRYYKLLSKRERVKLIGRLYDELLFYYTLYPKEKYTLKELLGIAWDNG